MNVKRTIALGILILPRIAWGQEGAADAAQYSGPAWSPYLAGSLIGVLTWLTLWFSKKPVSASSAYATIAGILGRLVAPRKTASFKYFRDNPPRLDWEVLFLGATVAGGVIAAWQGGELTHRWLPPLWQERFGEESYFLRGVIALLGGVLMAFGARIAGGCTSGHGISGTLQLNLASWIALICFFVGGVIVAAFLYSA